MTGEPLTVLWTKTAERDLRVILEYISFNNDEKAREVYQLLQTQAASLGEFSNRGRIVPELDFFGVRQYRELVIPPWRVVYKTASDHVLVLAVIDGRRNITDILLNRFVR